MTHNPRWHQTRHTTTTNIRITDPTAMEPFNAGSDRHVVPTQPTHVKVRTKDGVPTFVAIYGRRILRRDTGTKASGSRQYQAYGVRDDKVADAWGTTPPAWVQDLYDAWRSGNMPRAADQ